MTFGGLSAGGEWRKKRPGKWLKWREGFFRVSGVSSFHTIHTVRGFECRVVRGCRRRRRDSKKVTSGVRQNLPIQGIDESWCGVRRLDAEEGSLTKKTWVQKSRRHRRRVTHNLFHISKSCKLLGEQQHFTSNWVRISESSRTGPDAPPFGAIAE